MVPSENVPITARFSEMPLSTVGKGILIVVKTRSEVRIFTCLVVVRPLKLAVRVICPPETPVTTPVLLTVAMLGSELCQFAVRERSCALPSENQPFSV
jgi:hypothetical protein